MNNTKKYILTILLLPLSVLCFAQKGLSVSGRVSDGNGDPLTGAVVMVKGSGNGAMVTEEGTYALSDVPADAILVASCLGYTDSEQALNGRTEIDFTLQDESTLLEDVIVVAYGTAKKESFPQA